MCGGRRPSAPHHRSTKTPRPGGVAPLTTLQLPFPLTKVPIQAALPPRGARGGLQARLAAAEPDESLTGEHISVHHLRLLRRRLQRTVTCPGTSITPRPGQNGKRRIMTPIDPSAAGVRTPSPFLLSTASKKKPSEAIHASARQPWPGRHVAALI